MKTTVVPAQITTIEDRIAGNLTFIQIVLLICALILSTVVYAVVPPRIHLTVLKLVLIAVQFAFFGGLAIRFKGKILADWLLVILRYAVRPRIYIFTKNDFATRDASAPIIPIKRSGVVKETKEAKAKVYTSGQKDYDYRNIYDNSQVEVSIKPSKKGGLDVTLHKV